MFLCLTGFDRFLYPYCYNKLKWNNFSLFDRFLNNVFFLIDKGLTKLSPWNWVALSGTRVLKIFEDFRKVWHTNIKLDTLLIINRKLIFNVWFTILYWEFEINHLMNQTYFGGNLAAILNDWKVIMKRWFKKTFWKFYNKFSS